MRVLKILVEGMVSSFRYPHFIQGVHLTFEVPPPATIYGLLCGVVGEYIPRNSTRFAYSFSYDAKFFDYEHLHFFGKEPKMNPFRREQLFNPRLTLYLDNLDFYDYFMQPRYAVTLGRAQDLMTIVKVDKELELVPAENAYYENTLLPLELAAQIGGRTFAVTMPQFIDPERRPTWQQYAVLQGRVPYPSDETLEFNPLDIWVDPQADAKHPEHALQRGIIWHTWE